MKIQGTFLGLAIVTLMMSCQPSDKKEKSSSAADVQEVKAENISVILPKFLTPNDQLHDEAFIEYQNLIKEFYFISIRESKATFDSTIAANQLDAEYPPNLEGYAKFVQAQFGENVDEVVEQTEIKDLDIAGGKKAKYFEANAKVENLDIHYNYGFVQGESDYYQVLSWTLESRKTKNNPIMLDILKSFRELPN